ncbi:putative DnaJ domain, Chaperone J-domain superfamily [Helianthus annuus]|nr:putative DnaJ domain, Chaperone J-domain superfamily [Helianthus annuus]
MECNKEEAVRAKQLAEKKMEIKDFSGALKIALKAQQLYPELENISQLILVCEVHCSAEKKSYGTDKDWYGILKVEASADDITIKKQYRKLALTLHPDKNNFSGSTDAFKLIGEAQRVLLDREKRMVHDSKRRSYGNVSAPSWNPPKQPTRQSNVQYQHPWNQGHSINFTAARPANFQFTPQQFSTAGGHRSTLSTFWTVCPFCSVRYQFFKDVVKKDINCQSCKKTFTAYELNAPSAAAATPTHIHTHTQPIRVPPKPVPSTRRGFTTKPVFEKKETPKAHVNASRKRKKRIEESSESSDSSSSESSESEEDIEVHSESEDNGVRKNVDENPNNSDFQYFGEQPRRSARAKRNVSYKENVNDIDIDIDNDDVASPNENSAEEDTFWKEEARKVDENKQKESDNEKTQKDDEGGESANDDDKGGESANDDDNEEEIEPEVFECPDPEFSDFDQYRKEEKYEYEFVEVLSDFDENVGARVSLLEKVKGFVCLFSKKEGGEMVVSGSEKYRFAHMVLSCRMSGEEREGVPKGCYELDPASLPASTFE